VTPTETVKLTGYVKAMCPQQKIHEYTADAWHDVLAPYSFEDCIEAVRAVVRGGNPFVSVGEIVAEVKAIRSRRLESADLALPPADPDREAEYRAALKGITRHLGSGTVLPFRAIPGPKPGPSREFREVREEMAERRRREALARARDVDTSSLPAADESETA